MCISGTLPWIRGGFLFVAQMISGIVAAAVVSALFPGPLAVNTVLSHGTSVKQGLFIEMFLTAELLITVLMLAAEKSKATYLAPIGIGLSLFVAELTGMPSFPFTRESTKDGEQVCSSPADPLTQLDRSVPVSLTGTSPTTTGSTGSGPSSALSWLLVITDSSSSGTTKAVGFSIGSVKAYTDRFLWSEPEPGRRVRVIGARRLIGKVQKRESCSCSWNVGGFSSFVWI